ncbi:MAG: zinc-binding dehydrogenase [Verrucomicrobiae bacterium]|nr:zinc-binding dehydrogenase [Verrucomicrobiae bacterium]
MKTQAAILVEQRKPLVIDEVEIPSLGYGQVLVEVKTSRICGSQIGEIDGVKGPDRYLPHLLGHEGCGLVQDVGPEVVHVKTGQKVVMHWRPGAGIQSKPPVYEWRGKKVSAGYVTTFNRYAVAAENRLTPIPDDFDEEVAPLLADTLTTGFGIITNNARAKIGESVLVIGCGGIGLGVILGAKLAGTHPILAADLSAAKLQKAAEYGATHLINVSKQDLAAAVGAIAGKQGVDIVVDGTGNPRVIETAYALTHPHGRCVLFGVMPHDKRVSIHTLPLHFGKILTGSEGGGSQPHVEIPRYVQMIRDGVFDPRGFISHRVKLEQINEAIDQMRHGEVIHAIIHFS